ncbi:hypothetical protein M6B38_230595 [Iris pallida]|uniref:Secreted protein n=1 Tax=Iris pallida TaxID=29817 RepID=A0AAX6DSH5_IRIPA|nr:hypothetical protein M6B38_230595 [Iris pallida]
MTPWESNVPLRLKFSFSGMLPALSQVIFLSCGLEIGSDGWFCSSLCDLGVWRVQQGCVRWVPVRCVQCLVVFVCA